MLLGPRCFSQEPRARPGPAACGEQEPLTSFVLPWDRHWEGGDRKRKKQLLCITGVHGVFPGGLIPNWSPLAGPLTAPSIPPVPGPAATGQRRWLALGTVTLPKPAPPLCHSSFLGELSLCLESHGGLWKPGTAPSTLPSLFSPSWTRCKWAAPLASCCVLFLLNSHCFLHWDGLKYSSISQGLLGVSLGKEPLQGALLGCSGCWGQGSQDEST